MAVEILFPVGIVLRQLENGLVLGESLFYPGLSRLGARPDAVRRALLANARKLLADSSPGQLGSYRLATAAESRTVEVDVAPPRPTAGWRDAVRLSFSMVVWQHAADATLARVPALDVVVLAGRPDDLDEVLPREILAALRRTGLSARLESLAWVQRGTRLEVQWARQPVRVIGLAQRARKEAERADRDRPSVLKQVATDMRTATPVPAYENEEAVEQIADALTGRRPQSVLLIGPAGAGKTAAVRELVRNREAFQLGATPFYQTSGSRLVSGMSGFGMWQERCRELWKEVSKRRAVLHVGGLVELMEVGKSSCNQTGIAGFLRPYIARGDLLAIAECTPEQVPFVEREAPQLLDAFRPVRVDEPGVGPGRRILGHAARDLSAGGARHLAPGALDALDRLHRRYATYSAYPGRPLRFLQNLQNDGPADGYVTPADVLAAFARETGLPRVLLDPALPLDVAETRQWFASRVVGQAEAVELVVDLLATVKAGLARPNRPIASLLFIGPTGVGKTETAKALAEFLFGSRDRLTRFDMSEYADAVAVQRLAGGVFAAEGLLTAKVREQPFAVLLFDEFEKAHPAFFDLLLQILGEARLTDAGGRLADFRNTVVILTSNLGAESFQQGAYGFGDLPGEGQPAGRAAAAKEHFAREVERFLRPELFNRVDRIVPFAPLDAGTVRDIARREWDRVLARDGIRFRAVQLDAAPGVLEYLARAGFDARYGARPLKRSIERELLAPLAHQMNRYPAGAALSARLRVEPGGLAVGVKPRLDAAGRVVSADQAAAGRSDLAGRCSEQRRLAQLVDRCSAVRELRNDVFQLERLERDWLRRQQRGKKLTAFQQDQLARLARLRDLSEGVGRFGRDAAALEDEALLAFHAAPAPGPAPDAAGLEEQLQVLTAEWDALLLRLYALNCSEPGAIALALFGEERAPLFELARAYVAVAGAHGLRVTNACEFRLPTAADKPPPGQEGAFPTPVPRGDAEADEPTRRWFKDCLLVLTETRRIERSMIRTKVASPEAFLREPRAETLGIGLAFRGDGAFLRFTDEPGLHAFRLPAETGVAFEPGKVLVEVGEADLSAYLPPEGVTRRGFVSKQERRRSYDREKQFIDDARLDKAVRWEGEELAGPLGELLALRMRQVLCRMVLE